DHSLTLGFERQEEYGDSFNDFGFGPSMGEGKLRNEAYIAEHRSRFFERWTVSLGGRYDRHSVYGSHETWRATQAYHLPGTDTVFRASYGTGFKAPTINELYGSFGANPDLKPEKSRGWEVGIDQFFSERRYM